MKMAKITGGVVTDLLVAVEGFDIEDCFHPDVLAEYTPVEDYVQAGWVVGESGALQPPAPDPEPEATAEETPTEEAPPA